MNIYKVQYIYHPDPTPTQLDRFSYSYACLGWFFYSYVAGLKRCHLWCRVESRLLTIADHCIMVHANLSAGPFEMLLEGTSNEHLRSMHTILTQP